MKKIFLLICTFSVTALSSAQDIVNFGQPSKEEFQMKECSFDKDANRVVLLHEATSNYDEQRHLITVHHIRIKILKESGISAGDISIPYYRKDNFEIIDRIEALTINVNANGEISTEKVDRKSIFKQKTNDLYGEMKFAFPAVKVGSILEYQYQSMMEHYGGLRDWEFQEDVPVLMSRYKLYIVPNTEFAYRISKREDRTVVVTPDKNSGGVYFEMENIPALYDEPYMDARNDYLQKVIFQLSAYNGVGFNSVKYMASWNAVINEMLTSTEFGGQLVKNLPGTGDFIKTVELVNTPEAKIKMVHAFVANNMSWNGFRGKYAMDGVKSAWEKKTGSNGEINLILVNLLKDAGLDAYRMLVSERQHGRVNTEYPFVDQFNTVFACVMVDGKKYFLDATDKNCPALTTPPAILNTTALIIHRKKGGLINIVNDLLKYKETITAFADIQEDGSISGEASIENIDYARMEKMRTLKRSAADLKNTYAQNQEISLMIDKYETENQLVDSLPLVERFSFSGSLHKSGDYTILPLNFFTKFKKNPFISDERFSNVNFGFKQFVNLVLNISLPKNYTAEEIPKSFKMITPEQDVAVYRQTHYNKTDNTLYVNFRFEFAKSVYLTDEYPTIKEVYKRIFDYLKEPVLLKKN